MEADRRGPVCWIWDLKSHLSWLGVLRKVTKTLCLRFFIKQLGGVNACLMGWLEDELRHKILYVAEEMTPGLTLK